MDRCSLGLARRRGGAESGSRTGVAFNPSAIQSSQWNQGPCPDVDLHRAASGLRRTLKWNIELWHTDTVLKRLTGFPHRYFRNRLS